MCKKKEPHTGKNERSVKSKGVLPSETLIRFYNVLQLELIVYVQLEKN